MVVERDKQEQGEVKREEEAMSLLVVIVNRERVLLFENIFWSFIFSFPYL